MLLTKAAKILPHHWQEVYGYRPVLLETFVEKPCFQGTCYQAANGIYLGQTKGRGKLGPAGKHSVPIKDLWIYPLDRRSRQTLTRRFFLGWVCRIFTAALIVVLLLSELPAWPLTGIQVAKLLAPDGSQIDGFGRSVAVDGDTILIGTLNQLINTVYAFTRDASGTWMHEANLAPTSPGVWFALSVAIEDFTKFPSTETGIRATRGFSAVIS